MSDRSTIEWTDATWNPVTGCEKVSPGCDHCYAETFAERWRGTPGHYFERGFDVQLRPEKLDQPLRWRKPRKVFVNSMSDLFHDAVPDEYIARVFAVMAACPSHAFQVLTKRHGRMRALFNSQKFIAAAYEIAWEYGHAKYDSNRTLENFWPLPNVWLGVSVEDQQRAELRIPHLLATPAAVRFLSCEPLLGPVDLRNLRARNGALIDCLAGDIKAPEGWVYAACPSAIDWVIVGGESGPGARPMHPDWVRNLRDQCQGSAAFHFKQWGAWALGYTHGEGEDGPGDAFINPDGQTGHAWFNENLGYPTNYCGPWGEHSQFVSRVGKGRAGRELDGRTWDEFPAVSRG